MSQMKLRRIGNSLGIILNKDALEELAVGEGDILYAIKTLDGLLLTTFDPDFAAVVESNRDYMKRHRNALKELSKR